MPDTVYIVARKGVNYRHELAGAYFCRTAAESCAVECIKREPDDYHSYQVIALPMSTRPNFFTLPGREGPPFAERIEPVTVVTRTGDEVSISRSSASIPW